MIKLHIKGSVVELTNDKILIKIPKKTSKVDESLINSAVLTYLIGEGFIANIKTREVIIERY